MIVNSKRCEFILLFIYVINFVVLSSASIQPECKLNFKSKINELCQCCSRLDRDTVIECKENDLFIRYAYTFCLTWNNATQSMEITRCFFIRKNSSAPSCDNYYFYNLYSKSDITVPNLNDVNCKAYNREGLQCRKCIDGYGPAAFSDGVTCANCSEHKHLWIINVLFQLTMVTLLYIAVVLLQIKGTSSPFNIIIAYGQIGINALTIGTGLYVKLTCFTSKGFITFLVTLLGVLNLDFFRSIIPPLCITPSLKSINVHLFDYIIAVHPIILTVFIYIGIELNDRNYRIIFCPRTCLKCFGNRNWNPKETILNTCATFLLFSYSKFLFVSFNLLFSVQKYNCSGEIIPNTTAVLLIDPTIRSFHSEHIPYAILAFSVIVIFNVLPPLLLVLYPTKLVRKCLSCCGFRRWEILQLIMDIFQGWYKDGTDGSWDYRSLSALYMLLRFFAAVTYFAIMANMHELRIKVGMGVLHVLMGVMFLMLKPYKIRWMSVVDGFILILIGTLILTSLTDNKVLYVIETILGLLIILSSFVIIVLRCLKKITYTGLVH